MMNVTLLSELIDLMNDMYKKDEEIQIVFENDSADLFSKYTEKLQDIILTDFGVPKDNTVEMIKIHGDYEGLSHKDAFCRDFIDEWFFSYRQGDLTKETLIHNILNWKNVESEGDNK